MKTRSQGFTLVEIMIVVAILGILIAIALPAYNSYRERTDLAAVKQQMTDIRQRLESQKLADTNYARGDAATLKLKYQTFLDGEIGTIPSKIRDKYTVTALAAAGSGNQINIYMQAVAKPTSYKYFAYMNKAGSVLRCPVSSKGAVSETTPSGCEAF